MSTQQVYPFPTLPDYLAPGLRLVFVGINPGTYSARRGHYFARSTNRFWPAFSRSRLSAPIRAAFGRDALAPEDDATLLSFGIGFTDVVKRSSANVADLSQEDFAAGAPQLLTRLATYQPAVGCFHGVTGFRAFVQYALGEKLTKVELGAQAQSVGKTQLYVVPNPSPANAHFGLKDQIFWYDRLADFLDEVA